MCMHLCWLFPHKSSTASVGPAKLYTFFYLCIFKVHLFFEFSSQFFDVDILSPFNRWENRGSEGTVSSSWSQSQRAAEPGHELDLSGSTVYVPSHGEPQTSRAVLPLHQPFPDTARRSSLCCFLFPRYLLGVPVVRVMNGVTGSEGTGSVVRQTWFEC